MSRDPAVYLDDMIDALETQLDPLDGELRKILSTLE